MRNMGPSRGLIVFAFLCGFVALIVLALYDGHSKATILQSLTDNTQQYSRICPVGNRQQYVREVCRQRQWTSNTLLSDVCPNGFIDDRHKLFYCFVNKVGSISFRTLLGKVMTHNLSFANTDRFIEETGIRAMSSATRQEKQTLFSSYKSMLVVRHPLYRLYSAYQDKLSKPGYWNNHCLGGTNRKIIDRHLARHKHFNPWNDTLTFREFLELVGNEYHNGFFDGHWWSIADKCKPCNLRYDLLMRLETIDHDIPQLFDLLRNYENGDYIDALAMPHKNSGQTKQSTGLSTKLTEMSAVYAGIPQSTIDRLLEVYQKDMELFGYGWADGRMMTCQIPGGQGGSCC